jgi:pyruvate/2-oxoglutarate/acetoin dehydrogenase E1 component
LTELTYAEAINKALHVEMEEDPNVFVYGIGVPDKLKIFGTTAGLLERFGKRRCFDTPLSEDAMTGLALGAAVSGLRPVHVHIRVDFLLLALNQLVNMISSFTYGSGGSSPVSLVIRAIIGRGWGQGYQHSKSLISYFTHIPGLIVIAPSCPSDVLGLLRSAIRSNSPVIFLEHRWLYWAKEEIQDELPLIEIGRGKIVKAGNDITIVAISWMVVESIQAANILGEMGIDVEIIDPRTLRPLDLSLILNSVSKTKRILVADCDWLNSGFSAEIIGAVSENMFSELIAPPVRIGFADTPCPTVRVLEDEFYPNAGKIVNLVEKIFDRNITNFDGIKFYSHENKFKGPF